MSTEKIEAEPDAVADDVMAERKKTSTYEKPKIVRVRRVLAAGGHTV